MLFGQSINEERKAFLLKQVAIYIDKENLNLCLTPYTKINSRWIMDLNIKPRIINLLEKNIGAYIYKLWISKNFLDRTQKAQTIKKTDKLHTIKIKTSARCGSSCQ